MAISMLKIRRPLGRLIFNMGIAIPGKTVFLIETAPRQQAITWTIVDQVLCHHVASLGANGISASVGKTQALSSLSPMMP